MVVDTNEFKVRFDTKAGQGRWRHIRCVKLAAEAPARVPEGIKPADILRLDELYGEESDAMDDDASENSNEDDGPTELMDAAAGAVPPAVLEDVDGRPPADENDSHCESEEEEVGSWWEVLENW